VTIGLGLVTAQQGGVHVEGRLALFPERAELLAAVHERRQDSGLRHVRDKKGIHFVKRSKLFARQQLRWQESSGHFSKGGLVPAPGGVT